MKQGSITFLKAAVYLMGLITFSLCLFALPSLASYTVKMNPEFAYLKYPVLFGLYMTALPFFDALYQALNLLTYIERKNAFSEMAVEALSRIKYCAVIIVIGYVIGIFVLGIENALHSGIAIAGLLIVFTTIVIIFFFQLSFRIY
ncbi:hypothetical protein J6TS2_26150 [Heyndrickxia sporothermodurans]|nr:hypothetical protein J6TS2_26150 [Heyndrickxia sporothermodurans]